MRTTFDSWMKEPVRAAAILYWWDCDELYVKCNLKNVKTKSPQNPFCERLPRVLLSSTPSAQIKGASHVLCCVLTPKALLYVLAAGERFRRAQYACCAFMRAGGQMISRLFAHPAREIKANCEFLLWGLLLVASPKKLLLCGEVIGRRRINQTSYYFWLWSFERLSFGWVTKSLISPTRLESKMLQIYAHHCNYS
jgi:hypothetical protein